MLVNHCIKWVTFIRVYKIDNYAEISSMTSCGYPNISFNFFYFFRLQFDKIVFSNSNYNDLEFNNN